jgi:hypothetical protein
MGTYKVNVTRWTEYRTPSGRWSKTRHDEEHTTITSDEFENATSEEWRKWFGARVTRRYTRWGYLVHTWKATCPDGSCRYVYVYDQVPADD